jgi:serine/threonine-protein kinase
MCIAGQRREGKRMSTMIGHTVSHYRIIERLGGGGMGVVYKAEDTALKRFVALKFLPAEMTRDPEAKNRFVAEARAASSVDHPNICTVHEIGETEDGQLFICMTLYTGESLRNKIREGKFTVSEAVRVCIQTGIGLAKAHAQGIVHRDIKPANIMLTDEGQVKIVDFGLAKLAGQSTLTRSGTAMGTIAYMSPEQARGESVDARTDIWSLGMVLFELLTGTLPFKGDHEQALVYAILHAEPARAGDLRCDVPQELEKIIDKAMEKNPAARYQSMYELVWDLEEVTRRIDAGEVHRRLFRFRLRRRTRRILAIALPLFAVVAAGLGVFLWRTSTERAAPATIAVFTFTTSDATLEWFTGGLRDVIVANLTKLRRLRVKSADRAMYAGRSLPEIARRLGTHYILDGSVLRAGNTARVTVFLIDGVTDEQLWADTYEKNLGDIIVVQRDITRAVVSSIRIEVTPEEKALLEAADSAKPPAYEAYLKGVFYTKKMTVEGVRRGVEYFTAATAADPAHALSYVGLASAWLALGSAEMGVIAPGETARKAEEAAQKAIALNRFLGEPHRVLGQVRRDFSWDFAAAEQEFTLALERNPRDAETLAQLVLLQIAEGRYADASQSATEAQKNDPLTLWYSTVSAFASASQARWEDGATELAKTLEFNASFTPGHAERGRLLMMRGQYAEAVATLGKAVASMEELNPIVKARLACARARTGDIGGARAVLDELAAHAKTAYVPPAAFAMIHAGMGDAEKAFQWLQKALDEKAPQLIYLKVNPEWAGLRTDERFIKLLARIVRQE